MIKVPREGGINHHMAQYMDAYESSGRKTPKGYVWSYAGGCDYELITIEEDRLRNQSPQAECQAGDCRTVLEMPPEKAKAQKEDQKPKTLETAQQKRNRKAKARKRLRKMYNKQ